jgi:hypothetical protein
MCSLIHFGPLGPFSGAKTNYDFSVKTFKKSFFFNFTTYNCEPDTRYRSWLRHSATSRKVAGSIPDEVIGFFNWPSRRTTALGSTQPLTEMSTRNLRGDKGRMAPKADSLTAICEPIF